MGKFRKKPVEIEAVMFVKIGDDAQPEFAEPIPAWLVEAMKLPAGREGSVYVLGRALMVTTLEGEHVATPGDVLIRGVKGEIYPCKPDIFEMTYDPVEDESNANNS